MTLKKQLLAWAVALSVFGASFIEADAASLELFPIEQEAQQHCPHDVVVWLNLPTGIYHYQGRRWYGQTKRGAYVCEQEALQNGDRADRSGR